MQWIHKWIGRTFIRTVEGGRPWTCAIPRLPGSAASDGYLDETFVTKAPGPDGRYWRGDLGSFRPCFPGCAIGERPRECDLAAATGVFATRVRQIYLLITSR